MTVKFDIELKYIKNSINTRIPTYTDINLLTNCNYKKANFTILSNYLNSIDWIALFSQKNVNDMWLIFTQKLHEAVSKYVPLYNRNSRHKRIIPKALKKLINKKNKMWKLARKTKNAFFIRQHADLSRKCKRETNNNVRFKINNLCKSNNMKNFYDFNNKKIGRVKTSTIIKSNDTHEKVDNNVAVELFAKFFHSTFSIDYGKLHTMFFFCFRMNDNIIFDSNTINQLINKLPNKGTNGPDGISNFLLKKLSNSICIPLAIIFQNSFDNNKSIPTQWKLADIVPIFKGKGSKYDVNNYRPISLTSTVCKLMESVIHNNSADHCNLNNMLTLEQHGFRNNHSTTSVLLELPNDITKIIDDGNCVDVITVDFAKAFDSISHNKLIYKLQFYGICGKVQSWIKEFFNNRLFRVKLNNYKSNRYPVTSSVPQGTKLAPILYNLYCNAIVNNFKYAKVKMYAHDLTIYAIIKNDDDRIKLQNELNNLVNWAIKWQLRINYQKCHIIHFGNKPKF